MGTLKCMVCGITADASNKDAAISTIDHGANSKKCNGKDENCVWYANGVPKYVPVGDIDPKRTIQGITQDAPKVKVTTKSAPKKKSSR